MEQCLPPSVEGTANDGIVSLLTRTPTSTQNTSLKTTSQMLKITAGLTANFLWNCKTFCTRRQFCV